MSAAVNEEAFWLGDWKVEPLLNRIVRGEEIIKIDPRNIKVLQVLASRPGHVFSQTEIECAVWSDVIVTPNSVYQSIAQLRRAVGDGKERPKYIETIARKGYRLIAQVSPAVEAQRPLVQEGTPPTSKDNALARSNRARVLLGLIVSMSAIGWLMHCYLGANRPKHAPTEFKVPLTFSEMPEAANLQPQLLRDLATVALSQGKPQEARAHLLRALELERRRGGEKNPIVGIILADLAFAYVWEADYVAAEAAARDAVAAFGQAPEWHPNRIDAVAQLGYVLLESARFDEAEPYLSRALELSTQVFGKKSRTRSDALMMMGSLRYSQGRLIEAEQLALEAIDISKELNLEAHTLGHNMSLLVTVMLAQSRHLEAKALSEEILSIFDDGLRADHPHVVATRDLLAKSQIGLNEYVAAEHLLRENIALWQQNDGWSMRAAASASALGEALLGQGRIAEASEYLARASLELDEMQPARDVQQRFREHQLRLEKLKQAQVHHTSIPTRMARENVGETLMQE